MSVDAVLLCAGRGNRLRPLTDSVAKPALEVLGVPLAAWGLAALRACGLEVVVNVSHLGQTVIAALERLPFTGWAPFVEEPEGYGTAGTLRALVAQMGPRVVSYNGDLLTDLVVADLIESHARRGAPATLAAVARDTGADMKLQGGNVVEFVDRRRRPDAAGHQFIGVAVFERHVIARLPERRPLGLGETLFPELVRRGELAVHVHDGYALDVGTLDRYIQANLDVLYGFGPPPPVPAPGWDAS